MGVVSSAATYKLFFILVFTSSFLVLCCSANDEFTIESRYPPLEEGSPAPIYIIKKGSSFTLSCTSSKKFSMCTWSRPGGTCGLFSSEPKKRCSNSGAISSWTVVSEDEKTCSVEVEDAQDLEEGEWSCELQGSHNKQGEDEKATEFTRVEILVPSVVELTGPSELTVYEGTTESFTCKAKGVPPPTGDFGWTVGRIPLEGYESTSRVDEVQNTVEETIIAEVQKSWSGKTIACIASQSDYEGNHVEVSDSRTIRVEKQRTSNSDVPVARAGEFTITERFPPGVGSETPQYLLALDEEVTYSCTSTLPWAVCMWKRPSSAEPCGMFSDVSGKDCSVIWGLSDNHGWMVKKQTSTTCTITGKTHEMDAGEWNCELRSKPILNEHNVYENDQKYFEIQIIQQARMSFDLPEELDLVDNDDFEIPITIQDANPLPKIEYFLNSVQFKPEIVERTSPTQNSQGLYSFSQTVRYHAQAEDSGKKLIIRATQEDSSGNKVEESTEIYLTVKDAPPPAPRSTLGAGIIGAIVAIAAFILLAIILCCVCWRNGKYCFAKEPEEPQMFYEEKPEQGEMQVQTENPMSAEAGSLAPWGPAKPQRNYNNELLLGQPAPKLQEEAELPNAFAKDETRGYGDEGLGSDAGSIPDLNVDVTERDWKDTVQVLGPKFSMFADYVRGEGNGDSDEDKEDEQEDPEKGKMIKYKDEGEV